MIGRQKLFVTNGNRCVHVPPGAVPGDTLIDFVDQLVDQAPPCTHSQHQGAFRSFGSLLGFDTAILFKELGGSSEIAGAEHRVANPADTIFCGNFHGAFGYIFRRPKLVLVAIGIGKENQRALVAVRGGTNRITMQNFVLIEAPQMGVYVFRADVESTARQIFSQRLSSGINFRLKKGADPTGTALPPKEARDLDITFSRRSGESDDRTARNTGGVYRPINPSNHVIGTDDVMINPMNGAFGFDLTHIQLLLGISM